MADEQKTEGTSPMEEGAVLISPLDTLQHTMDQLIATAGVNAVYGKAIRQGDTVIIPAAEVMAVGGVAIGESTLGKDASGTGGSGGGGGGRTFARPVATIIISPSGVEIKPVIDLTKICLAALTTFGFMLATLGRMKRGR